MLNGRPLNLVLRNVLRPRNYVGVAKIFVTFKHPFANVRRYFFGSGSYPVELTIRTPVGPRRATLFGPHDSITATEVFCREVYRTPHVPRVVVDLGSNIGLSALYFLTRSTDSYCYLFEPDPRNAEKLRHNLSGFTSRFELSEAAVGERNETTTFYRESTGRYGTLDDGVWFVTQGNESHSDELSTRHGVEEIEVNVEGVNTVLERVVSRHSTIDLLKIDTEGTELQILRAMNPLLLGHVREIAMEWFGGSVGLDGFDSKVVGDMVHFTNRRTSSA